ncbi:hypothetical protein [Geothrix oryzisoli]|nr:hypothetical protein [Geothrix oryzisoli]
MSLSSHSQQTAPAVSPLSVRPVAGLVAIPAVLMISGEVGAS